MEYLGSNILFAACLTRLTYSTNSASLLIKHRLTPLEFIIFIAEVFFTILTLLINVTNYFFSSDYLYVYYSLSILYLFFDYYYNLLLFFILSY